MTLNITLNQPSLLHHSAMLIFTFTAIVRRVGAWIRLVYCVQGWDWQWCDKDNNLKVKAIMAMLFETRSGPTKSKNCIIKIIN